MDTNTFISLIDSPNEIAKDDIVALEELINKFPYCQSAYALLAKAHNEAETMHRYDKLRRASLMAADRSKLKSILMKPINTAPKVLETNEEDNSVDDEKEVLAQSNFVTSSSEDKGNTIIESDTLIDENLIKETEEKRELFDEVAKNLEDLRKKKLDASNSFNKNEIEVSNIDNSTESSSIENIEVHHKDKDDQEIKEEKEIKTNQIETSSVFISSSREGDEYKVETRAGDDEVETLLKYLQFKPNKEEQKANKVNNQANIIDSFLEKGDFKIKPNFTETEEKLRDLAETKKNQVSPIYTESMAKLYVTQKKFNKAIEIYQYLMLNNQEKKAYFADLIKEIENKLDS